ncbi:hypothetical protein [Chamaesiphon sp. VAR_69_metabat_338]|uniref:hypothetical protein n=1 Tax=Chamaesiphon sp. VAR_69_metabat_338 TaxID=2964704 RepID=UPI00286DFDED|nr:hypothetical protein [Chamaesiphon sp. VAR_69_metabat_338]
MTQVTETDIRELKDLIQNLDQKLDTGFAKLKNDIYDIEEKIDKIDTRLIAVEKKIDTIWWSVAGIILTWALSPLLKFLALTNS